MPHKPLDSDQEKLLYISSVIGVPNALKILETDVSAKYTVQEQLVTLKRVK